jgi:hypothetical protein
MDYLEPDPKIVEAYNDDEQKVIKEFCIEHGPDASENYYLSEVSTSYMLYANI